MEHTLDSGQPLQLVGMALLRGLVDESALREALGSDQALLEALKAQGSLDAEDLQDLARLVADESHGQARGLERSDPPTRPFPSEQGLDPWETLPPEGNDTDGTGHQVLRVLTLSAWKHYRDLRFLAEGGMGRVFRAYDPRLKRTVALKFLRREEPELLVRFKLEAQHQAQVEHANICKVYEVGDWQGQSYIAMQFVEGETLEIAAPRLSLSDKVKVMEVVAEAIHAAHHQGLIHRDLKPANIVVEAEARGPKPIILDFGLARGDEATGLTVQGLVIGTAHYMAPEQARGDHAQVGRRTDVYGLGATLHRVLTGHAAFAGTEGVEVIRRTLEEDLPSLTRLLPDLPEDLDTIVRKCMEKDPARRYESALAVAEDLRRWREGEPILARKPTLRYRAGKWARRHRLVVGVGAVSLVAVLVLAGMGLRVRQAAAAQARWAQHFTQGAERMEALARYIHLAPPHDLGPELALLHAHAKALETDWDRAGRQARGPGAYALGRAHLILGNLGEAQRCLEQAEALGFRTPEAQYALGRTLSLQYQQELQRALQVMDPALRAVQVKALDAQQAKALDYLRRGHGNALEPLAYQEGLLALFGGRYDEALAKVEAARRAAPWFYETLVLKADIHLARAREATEPAARSRALAEADAALQAARRHAPSDPRVLENLARRWSEEMRLAWDTGRDLEPLAQGQKEILRQWELLMPGDPGPRALEALTQANLAEFHQFKGQEPGPWERTAVAIAKGVLKTHPGNVDARAALAKAQRLDGLWKLQSGQDPTLSLTEAIEQSRAGLACSPAQSALLETLTQALMQLVEYRAAMGQDLNPTWQLVQQLFPPKILEGEMGPFLAYHFASLLVEMADADLRQERDPQAHIQRALDMLERSRGRAGNPYAFNFRLGTTFLISGQYLQQQGQDPTAQTDAAIKAYRAAAVANPTRFEAQWGLADAFLLQAKHLAGRGGDPMAVLVQGRKALEATARMAPTHWGHHAGWAESLVLEAEWRLREKRDPGSALRQALGHAEAGLAINERRTELWVLVAKIHRFRLEHLRGGTAMRALALKALEKALAIDPRHREALKERVGLMNGPPFP